MQIARQKERVRVDIPVTITTVLESQDATIIDLTENGAQVVGATLPAEAQFMLDYQGYSAFATVRWSEVDRMGIRFRFALEDGPLFDALQAARGPQAVTETPAAALRPAAQLPKGGFGRRAFG
jgi:hypothetical protein